MLQLNSLESWINFTGHYWQSAPLWIQGGPYSWGWGAHPMMWGAWGIGMMLMMLVFWALVIVAVVFGMRWLVGQGKETRSNSALEILRQRYAHGEINKEEFESKKKDLI
ncbi:MAG: SHOCT domain-containing protein [Chloroflexota bacterium]